MTRPQLHALARFNARNHVEWHADWPRRSWWPEVLGMVAIGLALAGMAVCR